MASEQQYRHEEIAAAPRGWRVRTVSHPSGAKVRLAFPPGPRRKRAGRLVSILHPNRRGYNPKGLHLSLCTDPQFVSELNPRAVSYLHAAKKAAEAGKFERSSKLLSKYQKKRIRETDAELKRKRGNPGNGAARMYRNFHGRSASEVLELHEALMESGEYTALGDNPELWLRPVKGDPATWGEAEISFEPSDQVKLAADARGEQLYLVGKNQALPLGDLQAAGIATDRRFISLGEAHAISYTTEKVFDRFQSIPYAHQFGEETGERPTLVYDKETKRLLLVGGAYSIAPVEGDLGASPGIVN